MSGYKNPAPTLARTSRMGSSKPLGAPFLAGSALKLRPGSTHTISVLDSLQ